MVLGAIALAAAVTLQAALGVATLLMVVPLPLALTHQAVAMLVLTVAVLHVARAVPRNAVSLQPVLASS